MSAEEGAEGIGHDARGARVAVGAGVGEAVVGPAVKFPGEPIGRRSIFEAGTFLPLSHLLRLSD